MISTQPVDSTLKAANHATPLRNLEANTIAKLCTVFEKRYGKACATAYLKHFDIAFIHMSSHPFTSVSQNTVLTS